MMGKRRVAGERKQKEEKRKDEDFGRRLEEG